MRILVLDLQYALAHDVDGAKENLAVVPNVYAEYIAF
jgi:hypothetical protein